MFVLPIDLTMKHITYLILFISLSVLAQNKALPKPIISIQYKNVLYRGIDNSLEINVPGAKSFEVNATGLRQSGKAHEYSWNVSQIKEDYINLEFKIQTKDSVFTTKRSFYIRDVKPMMVLINDRGCKGCIIELTKEDVSTAKLRVGIDDYAMDREIVYGRVNSFLLELPDGNIYPVGGDAFSESAKKMIVQFPAGSIFKISEVEYSTHIGGYVANRPTAKFMLVDKHE